MKTKIRGALLVLIASVGLMSCGSCSVHELEKKAMHSVFTVIEPELRKYLVADDRLDEISLQRELDMLVQWRRAVEFADFKTERQVYDQLVPKYVRYVESNPKLSVDQKNRRIRLVKSWNLRLREQEK